MLVLLLIFRHLGGSRSDADDARGNQADAQTPASSSGSGPFQGKWMSDEVPRGRHKLTIRLSFRGEGEFILHPVSLVGGGVLEWDEVYRYLLTEPGKMEVTLVSKTYGGEEVSTPKDRVPREWKYRFEEEGVLWMEKPASGGGGLRVQYTFRKDE